MNKLSLITSILMLFLLVSCGGGKGTAKLEITRGFLASNSSFEGGVIIYGKDSGTNEEFTVGIPTGNSTNINIPFGTYNIKVIGWNSNAAIPFNGPLLCAKTTFNFNTAGAVLQIQVTNNACNDPDFASTAYRLGNTGNYTFKPLTVLACGALFGITNVQNFSTQSSTTYCDQYGVDLRQQAPRFKIVYEKKSSLETASQSLVSDCQSTRALTMKNIPTKFPFKIELYKDNVCAQLQKTFSFPNGIEGTYPDFDSVITSDSAHTFLKLPTSPTNRGRSQFITELPTVFCGEGSLDNCSKIISQTSGLSPYQLDVGPYQRIKLPNKTVQCDSGMYPAVTSGTMVVDGSTCEVMNGHTYVRVKQATPGTSTLSWNGTNYTVVFGKSYSGYNGAQNTRLRKVYQTLKSLFGYGATPGEYDLALQDDYRHDGKRHYGALSEARHILSPFGVAGAFFDQTCSDTAMGVPVTRAVNIILPDGSTESVMATLTNPPSAVVPRYFHNGPTPDTSAADSAYNRRFIIRTLVTPPSTYETTTVFDFDCDNDSMSTGNLTLSSEKRVGRLEEQRKIINGTRQTELRRIVHYNTTLEHNARIELYSETVERLSGTIQYIQRHFYRGEKFAASSQSKYRVSGITYDADRSGSSFVETLNRFELDGEFLTPSMTYTFKDMGTIKKTSSSIGEVFSDFFARYRKETVYNFQLNRPKKEQGTLSSGSGGRFIQAYRDGSGSLKLAAFNGSNHMYQSYPSLNPTFITSDMNSSGSMMVVASLVGGNIRVDLFNGSTWTNTSVAAPGTTIKDLQVAVKDNGDYLLAVLTDTPDKHIYLSKVTGGGTPPSFNTYFFDGGDDEHVEMSLTKTATDFYLVFSHIDHMMGDSFLDYCKYIDMPASCNSTSFIPSINNSSTTTPYREVSATFDLSQLKVTFKETVTNKYVTIGGSSLPNITMFVDSTNKYSMVDYNKDNNHNSYYSSQLIWNAPFPSHAYVNPPFIQPAIQQSPAAAHVNMNMVNQTTWDAFFTVPATFKAIQ